MRTVLLCAALLACDDAPQGPIAGLGDSCTRSSQCLWALVCEEGRCVDGLEHGGGGGGPVAPDPDASTVTPDQGRAPTPSPPPPPPPPAEGDAAVPDAAELPEDAAAEPEPDMAPPPPGVRCDEETRRAVVSEGSLGCPGPPQAVTVDGSFQVFRYEASHPLADAASAFPCATLQGQAWEAPSVPTEACARAGVRPWHSVRWEDAHAACQAVGWRLCSADELGRACGGPDRSAYTFGPAFDPAVCNLRESWSDGGRAGPAPSGAMAGCVSAEGAHDLTGNLWEWVAGGDAQLRTAQGAGWRTIAERHRPEDLVCTAQLRVSGDAAQTYANPDVGFRCCRDL